MIRSLSLVWDPATAWVNFIKDRKNLGYVLTTYFLPVLLIAALGEGFTLTQWRTWTVENHGLIHFDPGQILVFEAVRTAVTCVIVCLCAYLVWLIRDPFYARYNFSQALMLVMYSLSPVFLIQVLSGFPRINLWLSWGVGILFSLRIFYYGVHKLAKTVPGSADGLFAISSAVIIVLTGAQRFMLFQCLTGHGSPVNIFIYNLAAKF